jgi:DNA polymerase I-like protein with 3'-5' exonuclease and polymerase domains
MTTATQEILYCTTAQELEAAVSPWWEFPPTRLGLDIETTSLNPRQGEILLIQLSDGGRTVVAHAPRIGKGSLTPLLLPCFNGRSQIVGHNLKFEYQWLLWHLDIALENLYCTQVCELLLTAGLWVTEEDKRPSLKDLVRKYLAKELDKTEQTSFAGCDPHTFDPSTSQLEYAALDAEIVLPLANAMWRQITSEQLHNTFKLEMLVLPVLGEIELTGVKIDKAGWQGLLQRIGDTLDTEARGLQETLAGPLALAKGRIRAVAMADIESWNQLSEEKKQELEVLADGEGDWESKQQRRRWIQSMYKQWKEEHPKPTVPGICTDGPINLSSPTQLQLAFEQLGIILPNTRQRTLAKAHEQYPVYTGMFHSFRIWRGLQKLSSSFGEAMLNQVDGDNRLHPIINQVISTGRMSMAKPNLQQIPNGARLNPIQEIQREVRQYFIADPGYVLIAADYSAIEFRIAAEIHHQPEVIEALKSGEDVHIKTAALMMHKATDQVSPGERFTAKTLNYGIMYQGGASTMAQQLNTEDIDQVKRDMKAWAEAYPNMAHGLRADGERALKEGYAVTRNGRKRYFALPKTPLKKEDEDPEAWRLYRSLQSQIRRRGANHPIQGASADITKLALYRLWKRLQDLDLDARLVNVVHDEIVLEAAEEDADFVAELVRQEMIEAAQQWFKEVPIEVEVKVGKQWLH